MAKVRNKIDAYVDSGNETSEPLLLCGDALETLKQLPDKSVDCCVTSPPYWNMREYEGGGIGLENSYEQYIDALLAIVQEIHRVLRDAGSFWLNIGDSYQNKRLLGIPWRIAIRMMDEYGWVLRNEVIWNKIKGGPDNAKDKLGNVHEQVFHFVKKPKGYYYDADSIRKAPAKTKVLANGTTVSATGVSGVRYKRQIELSTSLNENEKRRAFEALANILLSMHAGDIADFRMVIRGTQRTTHSNSTRLSGRAKELNDKGFYFLKYHKNGSKPRDVWDVLPEDTQKRKLHYAAYPEELCRMPILATCPKGGIVLDPFLGTGTTVVVARQYERKSIGIDISERYIEMTKERLK
ncbi:MAG TPA: site-specific DNA-methyltransferase [Patescibacteria group bacterium]|nr:site-specific DNA-methyltransferase [Patescibacteria group bacterium]